MRPATAFIAVMLLGGIHGGAAAQSCERDDGSMQVSITYGRYTGTPADRAVRATGLSIDRAVGGSITLRGQYIHEHGRGSAVALRTAAVGGSIALDVPFRPCIGLAVFTSGGNTRATDHYYNLTVPLAIGRGASVSVSRVTFSIDGVALFVYSATDARLFGFDMASHGAGIGATAIGAAMVGPVRLHVELRWVDLPDAIGPTVLGTHTIELGTSYRF